MNPDILIFGRQVETTTIVLIVFGIMCIATVIVLCIWGTDTAHKVRGGDMQK